MVCFRSPAGVSGEREESVDVDDQLQGARAAFVEVRVTLGAVQLVQVETYLWVANMVGQHGTRSGSQGPPVRYEAIDTALAALAYQTLTLKASVHVPRIG